MQPDRRSSFCFQSSIWVGLGSVPAALTCPGSSSREIIDVGHSASRALIGYVQNTMGSARPLRKSEAAHLRESEVRWPGRSARRYRGIRSGTSCRGRRQERSVRLLEPGDATTVRLMFHRTSKWVPHLKSVGVINRRQGLHPRWTDAVQTSAPFLAYHERIMVHREGFQHNNPEHRLDFRSNLPPLPPRYHRHRAPFTAH